MIKRKGEALLKALENGFKKLGELNAPQKALIFTESRRTQQYLFNHLKENGYDRQLVLLNGTNTEKESTEIYKSWLKENEGKDCISGSKSVDMRAALVDEFRNHKSIMIATESGAEGLNLQFCNLVVNYDLPWNPQRIEQRIGRCNILKLIDAAPNKRYEELSEFLSIPNIQKCEDSLRKAILNQERESNESFRSVQQAKEELENLQNELKESDKPIEEWVKEVTEINEEELKEVIF